MAYRSASTTLNSDRITASAQTDDVTSVNPTDKHIWGVYGFLIAFSIIELYSASSFEIAKQGLYGPLFHHIAHLLLGFLIILGLQRVHYKHFYNAGRWLFWGSSIAMVYVMFFGEYVNGARRAISLPFISLQPAEFIKLAAVMMLAAILSTTQLKKDERLRNRGLMKSAFVVLILSALLFTQGLTNTLILMVISFSMFLMGALEWKKLIYIILIYACFGALGAGVKWMMSKSDTAEPEKILYVDSRGNTFDIPEASDGETSRLRDDTWKNRILAFLGDSVPKYQQAITPKNLQVMRSFMAQANGGVIGVFPGNSRETSRLPLAFSDFIYAIIVEDLGLVGGMFVLLLYLWLLARAYMIARKCNQIYPAFLVTGCALLIATQALCHMAIVSGAGPVSGQPLPLFSKGGTSILVTSIAFGIMLSVSRFSVRNDSATRTDLKREQEALPTELQGQNPTQF